MRVGKMGYRSYFVYLRTVANTRRISQREETSTIMKQRARYGVDGPGVFRAHIVLGSVLALIAAIGLAWPKPNPVPLSLSIGLAAVALVLFLYAAVMLRSSLVSKIRIRDRLVAALALSGQERVLDAGCGLGLALIGCARKLTTGKAVGIDLWSRDLSG